MGNYYSKSKMIKDKLNEFEVKESYKIFTLGEKEVKIYMHEQKIGDFICTTISNKDYFNLENRFRQSIEIIIKEFKSKIVWSSKENFIESILINKNLRKNTLKLIRKRGLINSFRWKVWSILLSLDKNFIYNKKIINKRKQIYIKLLLMENEEIEDIVNKDIIRTNKEKDIFLNFDCLGTKKLFNVCKALGSFFPKIGYVQGMNFVAGFILEVSGLEEFESWNFLVNFFKKKKSLYFGLYEPGFPLLHFLCFAFGRFLELTYKNVFDKLKKIKFPPELWVSKWFLSFFIIVLPLEFILRIFDFLILTDVFGLIYIALILVGQLENFILKSNFGELCNSLQNKEILGKLLNFTDFANKLKIIEFDKKYRKKILEVYYLSLKNNAKKKFKYYYQHFKKHLGPKNKKFYNDQENVKDYYDYDSIKMKKIKKIITKNIFTKNIPKKRHTVDRMTRKEYEVLKPIHLN